MYYYKICSLSFVLALSPNLSSFISKHFFKKPENTVPNGLCFPDKHYMVDITGRLAAIKSLVDHEKYFTINRARQYGKTTTLRALSNYLQCDYYVVLMDFQTFDYSKFENSNRFSLTFAAFFLKALERNTLSNMGGLKTACSELKRAIREKDIDFSLTDLFASLGQICHASDKPIVLMIDEVYSASNNQIFPDFLAQLRAMYMNRDFDPTFQSVIMAGVYDIKNLKQKMHSDSEHKYNSPWNIAADFTIDMSFSQNDIAGMLTEYEQDYQTGMDISQIAGFLYDYTSGYPFLVSRICQIMDEVLCADGTSRSSIWTKNGFLKAVRFLLTENNTLFSFLINKLHDYPDLNTMLRSILFSGQSYTYSVDNDTIQMAAMFGFIKNVNGTVAITNRIFETRLYNYYLSKDELQQTALYKASLQDKNQFIIDGQLNMRKILEKFVLHFTDIYGKYPEHFLGEEGRQYFLLYLRPIINGTGNYYIEAQTRDYRRTDIIVDYLGKQYIIELKIWHGEEYHSRGEQQLIPYLNDYHSDIGYMLSFNFDPLGTEKNGSKKPENSVPQWRTRQKTRDLSIPGLHLRTKS